MAINIPIISQFDNAGIKGAKAAFANLKTDMANAQGGMAKLKVASGGAMKAIAKAGPAMALAAVGAITQIVTKGIDAFQDMALSAGKLADATGLTVEQASRFNAVAKDLGIESSTLTTGIGKMSQAFANGKDVIDKLNLSLAYTKTGTVDVNQTFINAMDAINKIKDPIQRAKAGVELFGKGWTEMSELIAMGGVNIEKALAGVKDFEAISPAELKKAKDYRAAMDQLDEAFQKMAVTLAEDMIPQLVQVVDLLATIADFSPLGSIGSGGTPFGMALNFIRGAGGKSDAEEASQALLELTDAYKGYYESRLAAASPEGVLDLAILNAEQLAEAVNEATAAFEDLFGLLDRDISFDKLIIDLPKIVKLLQDGLVGPNAIDLGFAPTEESIKAQETYKDFLQDILDLAINAGASVDELNELKIYLDEGNILGALGLVNDLKDALAEPLKAVVKVDIETQRALKGIEKITEDANKDPIIKKSYQFSVDRESADNLERKIIDTTNILQAYADKNPVVFSVGVKTGAELQLLQLLESQNKQLDTLWKFFFEAGRKTTSISTNVAPPPITVNVNGGDPQAVVKALQDYNRNVGPIPVNTRAN
jgi:hypothetical protein